MFACADMCVLVALCMSQAPAADELAIALDMFQVGHGLDIAASSEISSCSSHGRYALASLGHAVCIDVPMPHCGMAW
jgi:hypothetical protein